MMLVSGEILRHLRTRKCSPWPEFITLKVPSLITIFSQSLNMPSDYTIWGRGIVEVFGKWIEREREKERPCSNFADLNPDYM